MSEEALEARRRNAQLSTGPVTEEGKKNASMNALQHGRYATKFFKIPAKKVGNLETCKVCGDEQISACKEAGKCLLQDELTLAYIRTHTTGNVKYVENFNIVQLSQMDFIFTQKLRYAQIHLDETETFVDADGNERTKEKIDSQYMYMLMNMMKNLNKAMPDMQLTKQTQENIDVAWGELAKAEINPEKALEAKQKIMKEMAEWRKAQGQANQEELLDEAINQHRKLDNAANEEAGNTDLGNIGPSPFSNGR